MAYACIHADKPMHAKGFCKPCYLSHYYYKRKAIMNMAEESDSSEQQRKPTASMQPTLLPKLKALCLPKNLQWITTVKAAGKEQSRQKMVSAHSNVLL